MAFLDTPPWGLALFDLCYGLAYLTADSSHWKGTSYTAAKQLAPIKVWGAALIVVAIALALGVMRKWAMNLSVTLATMFYVFWGLSFASSAISHDGSPTAPLISLLLLALHLRVPLERKVYDRFGMSLVQLVSGFERMKVTLRDPHLMVEQWKERHDKGGAGG